MKKFHILAFATACGVTWGLGMFLLAFAALGLGVAGPIVTLIGSGYAGYEASVLGAFLGLIWGFVDAFIGGAVFAWLYNFFLKRLK